ncbi:MAG: DNA-processing protein DprA [Pseudonocardiales bacterium]
MFDCTAVAATAVGATARMGHPDAMASRAADLVTTEQDLVTLRLAITATRHGGGPRGLAKRLRSGGGEVLDTVYERLSATLRGDVDTEAESLAAAGVTAVILGRSGYPPLLAAMLQAPPALFVLGDRRLPLSRSLGMCGSRKASVQGLLAARACGDEIARVGVTVVSGYAHGVDAETHRSALIAGGRTVAVLPEGIAKFRRHDWHGGAEPDQLTAVSQFSPTQPWSVGTAMARNTVIVGLGLGLVVVEAGEKGGTLNAGQQALSARRPVFALQFGDETPSGNQLLIERGAIPVRSRADLAIRLNTLPDPGDPAQPHLL